MPTNFGAMPPMGRPTAMAPKPMPYVPPAAGSPTGYAANTGGGFDNRMLQSKNQINDGAGIAPRLAVNPHAARTNTSSMVGAAGPSGPNYTGGTASNAPAAQTGIGLPPPQVARSIEPGMAGYNGPMPAQPQMNGMAQNIPGGLYQQTPQMGGATFDPNTGQVTSQPANLAGGPAMPPANLASLDNLMATLSGVPASNNPNGFMNGGPYAQADMLRNILGQSGTASGPIGSLAGGVMPTVAPPQGPVYPDTPPPANYTPPAGGSLAQTLNTLQQMSAPKAPAPGSFAARMAAQSQDKNISLQQALAMMSSKYAGK